MVYFFCFFFFFFKKWWLFKIKKQTNVICLQGLRESGRETGADRYGDQGKIFHVVGQLKARSSEVSVGLSHAWVSEHRLLEPFPAVWGLSALYHLPLLPVPRFLALLMTVGNSIAKQFPGVHVYDGSWGEAGKWRV